VAIAASAVAAGAALGGCGTNATRTSTPTTTETLGPASASDWRRLGATLTGTLVLPSNRSYSTDRLLYNSKFTDPRPAAIAYCDGVDDVSRCVDFVARHDLTVAARSGGHSYGGYSSCDGLVIDVSRFNSVAVDPSANVARIGAGTRLIDVYDVVGNADRLLPGGSCPTVGIAGLTLGGGVGVFARKFGLTSDNLRSVEIVTASGDRLTADASDHADLLWGCQGGGGGNFGIATSFEFAVHPMPLVTLFSLQYSWAAAATVLEAWQHWIASAPDEIWSNCQLLSQGTYGFLSQVSGVYCGSAPALESLLAQLRTSIGAAPVTTFVGSDDYVEAMKIEAGCSGLSIASCHLATDFPGGTLSREAYSAKSSYLDSPTSSARAAQLVHAVETLHDDAPTVGGGLAFDAYGGAVNRLASDDTAFVHRNKLAGIQATYSWTAETPRSVIAAGERWLTWLGETIFTPETGAYQNYIDPTLEQWRDAYYGSNLARLVKVKATYDPQNRFRFAQSIPVAV